MSDDRTRADYTPGDLDGARQICRLVAHRLVGIDDEIVVVGGIVPTLLVGTPAPSVGAKTHVGTKDVDLGLALKLVDEGRYAQVTERLGAAGFTMDTNEFGNVTPQRWVLPGIPGVSLDFLVEPTPGRRRKGDVRRAGKTFGAYMIPGLRLAFEDRVRVSVGAVIPPDGTLGETIQVCDAGAFVVLKALALQHREKPKDAYDLDWLLQAYPGGLEKIAEHIRRLSDCDAKTEALEILDRAYRSDDSMGPVRAARFFGDATDATIRADAFGRARDLLDLLADL